MMSLTHTGLWGPGLAVPPTRITQEQLVGLLTAALDLDRHRSIWLRKLCRESGIQVRYTCVPEFSKSIKSMPVIDSVSTYYAELLGGLSGRMERYRKAASALGTAAARRALQSAGVEGSAVTHFIWVTCTGFETPGPDLDVADQLGLGSDVHRVHIGFMGCQAAIQGLRVSDAICRSEPEAVVLLVCAELCTLHFDLTSQDPESLVVASLFGDGAGAALLSRRFLAVRPLCCIVDFASERVPGSEALLTWRLGEPAFQMGLSRSLPDVVGRHIGSFAQRLRPRAAAASRTGWAAHPGGRAILDAVQAGLGLEGEALSASRRTLADHGNMSSATLLFVLDQVVPRHPAGVALALGPGLSLEGLRWVRSP